MLTWPTPYIPTLPGSGMQLRLHDSLKNTLVEVGVSDDVSMYVCGVTPYDAAHLGHAATYVAYDVAVRVWLDAGKNVTYVQNVTDVDDPLLERATRDGVDWQDLARQEIGSYRRDMTALSVIPPTSLVSVVESVPAIADSVATMLQTGAAYRVDTPDVVGQDVYADIEHDDSFTYLLDIDDSEALAVFSERGGDPSRDGKRHALDPLLWRAARDGEPSWPHEVLGEGRPGWHVECSVIARHEIGGPADVQGGGRDLAFPHHPMSSSHSRMLFGEPLATAFSHAGLVGLDGEKMSKSKGNLVFVGELVEQGVPAPVIRLALLSHHYRTDWMWTDEVLKTAQERFETWRAAFARDLGPDAAPVLDGVRAALANDVNAPAALAIVDAWCEDQLERADGSGCVEGAPGVVSRTVDALLGVRF